jgi:formate dehydrogenase gamma subunit
MGSGIVANCSSCHGVHNIYRSTDPRSTINRVNLAKTCGQCHPGAGERFAQVKVHVGVPLSKDIGSLGAMWVRRIYVPMIFLVIGGMLLHNFVLWRRKLMLRRNVPARTVQRMNLSQRVQHWLILSSFIVLAVTGFALKYPDSPLAWVLGSSETVRRMGHRIAAVVMIGAGLYHLVYLLSTREGRRLFLDFLPTFQDLRDVRENLFYHLGWSKQAPKFGRFTYGEKAEYLALAWGTFLMAATGLLMWFKLQAGAWFTGASVDIATAIHFYEAVLAVLAIVVWHFYQVMFDPDVYPIDWTFWDGRMSAERAHHHHGRMYDEPEKEAEPKDDAKSEPKAQDEKPRDPDVQ